MMVQPRQGERVRRRGIDLENRPLDDQVDATRFARVRAEVLARPGIFAASGRVAAGWRREGNVRFGPYYRLAFRDQKRQRSIYLGRSAQLAAAVEQLLAKLQQPRRSRRALDYLRARVRRSLRRHKADLACELAVLGIELKGFEFRGQRKLASRFREPPL